MLRLGCSEGARWGGIEWNWANLDGMGWNEMGWDGEGLTKSRLI